MSIVSTDIKRAVKILSANDVVAIPTETVYGLAGNIYSDAAIRRIFEVKQRPLFNPLIVHISHADQLSSIVREVPTKASILAEAFWPGSLTLVLPKRETIPSLITAGKDTVAVRVPRHPLTLRLLEALPFPVAAPSANPFNRISPTSAAHVAGYFEHEISMVLDGGTCQNGLESTIVGFVDGEPVLYRLGSISREEIEAVVGPVSVDNKKDTAPTAPGMLAKHYSPKTKTYLTDDLTAFISEHKGKRMGVITFCQEITAKGIAKHEILSPEGDLKVAASKLYHTLHQLDGLSLDLIVAERFPDRGLGRSINDRLERASK